MVAPLLDSFPHWLHDLTAVFVHFLFFCLLSFCSDLDDPEGLAYDWVNKRLYFTDYYRRNVQSMGLDGANRSVIANANRPRGIIVDPCYG